MRSRVADRLSQPGIRLQRLSIPSKIALVLLALVGLLAVTAPLFAPDALATGVPAQPPSGEHWFGTDRVGRDVFARVAFGARYSIIIGLGATAVGVIAGAVLGGIAATSHKFVNESVMRALDVLMAFPGIALAAVLVAVFGSSVVVLIIAIALVYLGPLARVVRANVLAQYGEDYVTAARVIGARRAYLLVNHVAINCAAPVLVFGTVLVADAIIYEASLSFIGAGIPEPLPSWGNVLSYGRQILLSGGWWATFFPGVAILLTVLALNVLAEGITDAWATPKSSARRHGGAPADGARPAGETQAGLGVASLAHEVALDEHTGASVNEDQGAANLAQTQSSAEAPLAKLASAVRDRGVRVPPLHTDAAPLLSVENLRIRFPKRHGKTSVVDGVSFHVRAGETLGLVGESGCGKSLTGLAVMGLLPREAEVIGRVMFDGRDLLTVSPRQRREMFGPDLAMVYQDALSSLNPSILVGKQLKQLTKRGGSRTPKELLELVNLSPDRTMRSYPHELSGGQRQRVLIAMALSRNPRLLIADEPTTALDVTVQAEVVELLTALRDELGFAMVLVSHDLGLIGEMVHRVAVMYAGQLAEVGSLEQLFVAPRHHYSRGLLGSVLSLESATHQLHQIPGVVPAPRNFVAGCRFADRCPAATSRCYTYAPVMHGETDEHEFACWHPAYQDSDSTTEARL